MEIHATICQQIRLNGKVTVKTQLLKQTQEIERSE